MQISPTAEITLEANPGTFEREKFAEYRAIGFNRLSIGIQSFNDDHLKSLGRIHGRREAIKAAEAAHAVGFANFNLDLMFGLPNQTPPEALSDLQMAIDLEPTHLSYYQLTLEPNTLFFRHPPLLPEDDTIHLIHEQGQERLAEAGYQQYEISAYAQTKQACQHNLNYWRFGDYVGIGAGAHGKITDAFQQNISRTAKSRHPKEYLDESQRHTTVNVLTRHEAAVEFMMNALRLNDGFATTLFAERVGLPINIVEKPLRQAEERGLIQWDMQHIRPTERGRRYLNNLLELFV